MPARFLLGPAGSGKTFRCLREIHAALAAAPDGPPLILLAPKQATFQLERQLLADRGISGFTRLNIFSFDRLAKFIFQKLNVAPPLLLAEEGRVMILRALLRQHTAELKLFGQSARRPGFAQELGAQLAELQQHQFTPARLHALAQAGNLRAELRDKLNDLALLLENYTRWLAEHGLQDANCLLDFATAALREHFRTSRSALRISGLWLDGFAEMTPQELDLLATVLPFCENATLAFCLDATGAAEDSWLSIWHGTGKTFQQSRQRIENLPGYETTIETLHRDPQKNRFRGNPALAHLEKNWSQPARAESALRTPHSALSLAACPDPEAEAVLAAREILKFVSAGNRFRDCAVLVRNLDGYHQPLARVFRRYGIPFFLDRRESVAHHPLAELTRSTLRTVAGGWQNHDDWFAVLKSGFAPATEMEIDRLEYAALEFGWRGKKWRELLPDNALEKVRLQIFPPFENCRARLEKINFKPDGAQLAAALRELWSDLKVERTLEGWSASGEGESQIANPKSQIHSTVFEQLNSWLDNLALAFPREPLPLRDWLPILEAGLASLSVGVVPPVLDEVLVGAIDRARNPDLKFALVLGLNESVFPAAPVSPAILTEADRGELGPAAALGPDVREQLSRERYLGYIACTRASEKLLLACSRLGADGRTLNPSPFIGHLQRIFPGIELEEFAANPDWREAAHANELAGPLLEIQNSKSKILNWESLLALPALKPLAAGLRRLREPDAAENLSPELAGKLFGKTLRTSVSRLEEFAACPFRFFARVGLHAGERKIFELDARERGNFQHEILKIFHEQLAGEGKRWRDLTPAEARERIGQIATGQMEHFRDGLLRDSAAAQFSARAMTGSLQNFVAAMVTWMRSQYQFDPGAAELDFGSKDSRASAWEIELAGGHQLALQGRIDRVDLCRDGDRALCVVTDYKSGGKKLDAVLVEHGVQLQLLAYLGALRHWKNPREIFGVEKLFPAGAFYVNLRGEVEGGQTRDEALAGAQKSPYRHNGRFDAGALPQLDSRQARDQFNYALNKDGGLRSNLAEALSAGQFEALLGQVEARLAEMGGRIFSGAAQVAPYRKGSATACDFCDYRAACRIDPWTHQWRVLRAKEESSSSSS